MRFWLWVFIITVFLGSGLRSFGDELIAQSPPIPPVSQEDSSVCLDYETRTSRNTCEPDFTIKPNEHTSQNYNSSIDETSNQKDEEISLLPDPEVQFIEDYMVKFDSHKAQDTIFFGGVVPFVALPDSELVTEDSFFNDDSFSVFFYLKRKF